MAITEIDGTRQIQDSTVTKAKVVADFTGGVDWNISNGNQDATITNLRDGTAASQDAATVKQMENAIAAAITGGMTYKGQIDASIATGEALDGASVGDFWYVSTAGTLDGKAFSIGDHLVVNAAITDFSVDGAGKLDLVDNTESTDILRDSDVQNNLTTTVAGSVLDATQGKALKDAADLLQTEVNDTQAGAGLATDGSYVTPSGSNYIDASTSLASADSLLDAQIKFNADAIAALPTDVYNEKPVVTNGSAVLGALANIPATDVRVYLNGMRMEEGAGNDYTINLTTGVITFEYLMKTKDKVIVDYKY